MALVNTRELLEKAHRGGYAVGAFNVYDYLSMRAVIESAAEMKSPAILQILPPVVSHFGAEAIALWAKHLAGRYFGVPLFPLSALNGFPEPFSRGERSFLSVWSAERMKLLVREDIRDAMAIRQLSMLEMLTHLLPERVGSPLSIAALREDLRVTFETVRDWITILHQFYYSFALMPYSKSLARAIHKAVSLWNARGEANAALRHHAGCPAALFPAEAEGAYRCPTCRAARCVPPNQDQSRFSMGHLRGSLAGRASMSA